MCVIVIKIGLTALGYRKRFDYIILKTKQNYLYSNTQRFGSPSVLLSSYCPLYTEVFFINFIIILYKSTIRDFLLFFYCSFSQRDIRVPTPRQTTLSASALLSKQNTKRVPDSSVRFRLLR